MGNVIETVKADRDSHFKLLPCQKCPGGEAVYEKYQTPAGDRWRVRCQTCGNSTDPAYYTARHTAQVAWNRRARL